MVVSILILSRFLYGDTFTNTNTGETVKGTLVAKTQKDGQPALYVRADDGNYLWLIGSQWKVKLEPRFSKHTTTAPTSVTKPRIKLKPISPLMPTIPKSIVNWEHGFGEAINDPDSLSKTVWSSSGIDGNWPVLLVRQQLPFLRRGRYILKLRMKSPPFKNVFALAVALHDNSDLIFDSPLFEWPHKDGKYHEVEFLIECPKNLIKPTLSIYKVLKLSYSVSNNPLEDICLDTAELVKRKQLTKKKKPVYRYRNDFLTGGYFFLVGGTFTGKCRIIHFSDGTAEIKVEIAPKYKNIKIMPKRIDLTVVFKDKEIKKYSIPGTIRTARHPEKITFSRRFVLGKRNIESIRTLVLCLHKRL